MTDELDRFVSIVILNWNGLDDTIQLIDSLFKQTHKNFNITVVDNASTGDDVEVLKKTFNQKIHILKNKENFGFAEGNNIGIRYALKEHHPEYVWLLNNDAIVDENALLELIDFAKKNTGFSVIGSRIVKWGTTQLYCAGGGTLNSWTGIDRLWGAGQPQSRMLLPDRLSYISGTSMFIRSDFFSKVGFFDPDYFLYNEEADLCTRAVRKGALLGYCPNSTVYHKVSQSSGYHSPVYIYYFLRNKLIFLSKNGRLWQYPTYFCAHILYYCLGFLVLGIFRQHKNNLPIIWQAWSDFIRKRWSYQPVKF